MHFTMCLASLLAMLAPSAASAASDADAKVDVHVREEAPARRVFTLEWNPAALLLQRVSANLEIAPAEHHTLILSPYYFYPRTAAFTNGDGQEVLSQKVTGFGGEIGYRYYAGRGGLRGFFFGPSFIAAKAKVTAGDGTETSFDDFGFAADLGYQALVGDRVLLSLGAGAQYLVTTESIPDQQMPANVYANRGLQPRLLFALGYAF